MRKVRGDKNGLKVTKLLTMTLSPLLIITVLFSLYHFWLPWQNISRILGVLPYTYAVRKKENLYIGIFVHCLCNLVGSVQLLVMVL